MEPLEHYGGDLPSPRREAFIDPFNHRGWLEYFENLLPRFRYIRFVGLPSLKDVPDVPLERLYVPLRLGPHHLAPGADRQAETVLNDIEAIDRFRHLVVLGDPGSGKSTLTSYLVTAFASRRSHPLEEALGPLIPLPFVLRDFSIPAKVTFDQLLDQFLAERYWSPKLTRKDLLGALERGQGLVLLDGLDEIGDVDRRRDLRRAVLEEGLARFPSSCWLLTSRIVGYEDVPFDEAPARSSPDSMWKLMRRRPTSPFPPPRRLYLLPFDLDQIRRFAENWYAFREADPVQRREGVKSLLSAIQGSPSIERLAHTPNLLQMMALIHKVYARLPSGRALLYDRIAEAYLESIDESRKIKESAVPASRQRRWLGSLAYDLQRQRARAGADASEILVAESEVEAQIRRGLGPDADAARELSYIARRSGLLLPRKPGFFSFVHLSFQEYFAACHLYDRLMGFGTRDEAATEVRELAGEAVWHETLIFLFEKLSDHSGASDWLFRQLFPETRHVGEVEALLAAELLGDLHSGLSEENLERAASLVVSVGFETYSQPLLDRLDALSEETSRRKLLNEVERRLSNAEPSGADGLLFLQNLTLLKPDRLEALLADRALARIEARTLYYLYPLSWASDGPVFRELVSRLPMELWFASAWDAPLARLASREIPTATWGRQDFLAWCAACDEALAWLLIKLFLADSPALDRTQARDLALDLDQNRARPRALDLDLERPLARARARAPAQAQALALAQARPLAQALSGAGARHRARDRTRDLDRDLARVLARGLDRDLEWAQSEKSQVRGRGYSRLFTAFLVGDEGFVPTPPTSTSPAASPGLLVLHYLGQLLLGRGGSRDWLSIELQVDILSDPAWARAHLPFLRPGEMETALRLLGLRMEGGTTLFEAEWFAPGHPLAPALNARPSEFAARIDELAREKTE